MLGGSLLGNVPATAGGGNEQAGSDRSPQPKRNPSTPSRRTAGPRAESIKPAPKKCCRGPFTYSSFSH